MDNAASQRHYLNNLTIINGVSLGYVIKYECGGRLEQSQIPLGGLPEINLSEGKKMYVNTSQAPLGGLPEINFPGGKIHLKR